MKLKKPTLLTVLQQVSDLKSEDKLKLLSILSGMFAAKVRLPTAVNKSMFSDDLALFLVLGPIDMFCSPEDQFVLCKALAMHLFADVNLDEIIDALKQGFKP